MRRLYDIMLMKRLLFIILALVSGIAVGGASELRNLCVNRMQDPHGLVRTGQFSWQIVSEENDVYQVAWYIKVASTREGLQGGPTMMWDSERREGADMVQVYYQGRRFPYDSTVYWQLEVWLSNNEHLQSPVQEFHTGSKGTVWNSTPLATDEPRQDYFRYLRWLHTLMIHQAESGELFQPEPGDILAIPADRAAAVLYSLYREEGDVKSLYDYYNMVRQWMYFRCQQDSTVSAQLIDMMTEMARQQNLQGDVIAYSRIKVDSTAYEPFWLYTDEPAWCGGAIRQSASGIAYNRVEIMIPSLDSEPEGHITHECPYGTISSEWSKSGDELTWNIQIPVGVRAQIRYPEGYVDAEGNTDYYIGSGSWELKLNNGNDPSPTLPREGVNGNGNGKVNGVKRLKKLEKEVIRWS